MGMKPSTKHMDYMRVTAVILLLVFIALILYAIMNQNVDRSERSESIQPNEINIMDIEAQVVQCAVPQSAAKSEQESGHDNGAGHSYDHKPFWDGPDSSPKPKPNVHRLTTLEVSLEEMAQSAEDLYGSNQEL